MERGSLVSPSVVTLGKRRVALCVLAPEDLSQRGWQLVFCPNSAAFQTPCHFPPAVAAGESAPPSPISLVLDQAGLNSVFQEREVK